MITHIVGIDPGNSTGVVVLYVPPTSHELPPVISTLVLQGDPSDVLGTLADRLQALVDTDKALHSAKGLPDVRFVEIAFMVERYVNHGGGGKRTQQSTAQHVIGQIKLLAEQLGNSQVIEQAPGDVKAFAPNAHLRALGLHTRPTEVNQRDANDANDAMRHALMGVARLRAVAYNRLLEAWGQASSE